MPLLPLFALLPFCLWLGVAAQGVGVYAVAILPALVFLSRRSIGKEEALTLIRVGASLFFIYALFPLANLISQLRNSDAILAEAARVVKTEAIREALLKAFDPQLAKTPQTLMPGDFIGWKALLSSRFSTSFLISSLLMIGIGIVALNRSKGERCDESLSAPMERDDDSGGPNLFGNFVLGCAVASLVVGIYMVIQTITGFDPRSEGHILAFEHRQDNGLYRIFGLYGHPLYVAGVALFWAVFNGWLVALWISDKLFAEEKILDAIGCGITHRYRRLLPWVVGFSFVAESLFVVLSGGRTALLALFFMIGICGITLRLPKRFNRMRWVSLVGALPVLAAALYLSGGMARFQVAFSKVKDGAVVDDRLYFWKVHGRMFLDSPWFGQGHAHLEAWVRRAYYLGMDYSRLAFRKNFNAHCLFLETLTDIGIVGSLLLVIALVLMWNTLRRAVARRKSARLFFVLLAWGVVANLLHGVTENTFFAANIALVYLMCLWTLLWLMVVERET